MRPALKRTIITSKTTGRRYYLGRSANRPNGRRYYVCSKPDCEARLTREADLFCRSHSQLKTLNNESTTDIINKSDYVDDDILNDNSEIIDEETSITEQQNTNLDSNHDEQQTENNDSITEDNFNDTSTTNHNSSLPSGPRQKTKANRQVHVDEATGTRTFRDSSGRRRYLCIEPLCTNMLKRQADVFCRTHKNNHTIVNDDKTKRTNFKRYSAPPLSNHPKHRFRSPFIATTSATVQNGNHSDEYESPPKPPEPTETNRSFRDISGKLRFLCLNPSCNSRLIRRSDIFCKRHQLDIQVKENENNVQSITTNDNINHDEEENNIQEMDVNHNNTDTPSPEISPEPSIKKRKHESQATIPKALNLSSIPANKMVISTTTLLDEQWTDILMFLRQFPQVQLSANLNVNNSTTHLLVDDSENHLHCTITKKIVQAAVRHHIFIISTRWINKCINSNSFVDEHPYEIVSDSHTTLRLSLQNFQINNHQYLFHNTSLKLIYGFAIECRQCQGSINRNELIELIELTGAKFYENDPTMDILVVLCDANEKNLNKIKEKYLQTNISNIKYVTSDFFLKSIIKFEIQDMDKYSL